MCRGQAGCAAVADDGLFISIPVGAAIATRTVFTGRRLQDVSAAAVTGGHKAQTQDEKENTRHGCTASDCFGLVHDHSKKKILQLVLKVNAKRCGTAEKPCNCVLGA
jgi:hypothetical protein